MLARMDQRVVIYNDKLSAWVLLYMWLPTSDPKRR